MKKIIKKTMSIFLILIVLVSNIQFALFAGTNVPAYSVSGPSAININAGGSLSYTVTYYNAEQICLAPSYIALNGFTANISVSGSGNTRSIILNNIQGSSGTKSIGIRAGSASNSMGSSIEMNTSYSFNLNGVQRDTQNPVIAISAPNKTNVYVGDSVSYTISFSDNKGIDNVNISSSYIVLNGFTANVSVSGNGNTRVVTLSNIQGTNGSKSISVRSGAVLDTVGNGNSKTGNSPAFNIVQKKAKSKNNNSVVAQSNSKPVETSVEKGSTIISKPSIIKTSISDAKILGNKNEEITSFSSWLKSEKGNITYAQENNYVAADETMTYMVEYNNGSKEEIKNAKFSLTIPQNIDVVEITGNGYIVSQNEKETIIGWDVADVKSGAICRFSVNVKFLQNSSLELSKDISQIFYPTLKTVENDNVKYSYLRQLFIDKNTNKTGTYNKYMTIDGASSVRPNDEITRAEFAKMLADIGIIKVESGNEKYKEYADAEEIPADARDAISALMNTEIMIEFSDKSFKPNNPILRDDLMKMVANASRYMSEGKLEIPKPLFIYKDILEDKDGEISPNKEYIMELIRQNVITKSDSRPDEYTLRKEAMQMLNSLTFRGPFVNKLPDDNLKIQDISETSKYFYDIVGATTTYTYTYGDKLYQKILKTE